MNHSQRVLLGAAAIGAGSWLLYTTFEQSGRRRPFWIKLLPGA